MSIANYLMPDQKYMGYAIIFQYSIGLPSNGNPWFWMFQNDFLTNVEHGF